MNLFSFKSIVAITIAASSFASFAAHPSLQFQIRGTFDEVVPPCSLSGFLWPLAQFHQQCLLDH